MRNRFTLLKQRVRHWVSRLTGVSTPIGGLSWESESKAEDKLDAAGDRLVLTPFECAQVLRVDEQTVIDLLEAGSLRGFSVIGEWRIARTQITEFLQEQIRAKEFDVLRRRLSDPRGWAIALRQHPEMMSEMQSGVFSENSFGKFLQDSLKMIEEDEADQVK